MSVRVVAGLWMVAAVLLGIVYRSNLKAMLIVLRVTLPFDSLEELVQTRIPTAIMKDNSIHRYIMVRSTTHYYIYHVSQLKNKAEVIFTGW